MKLLQPQKGILGFGFARADNHSYARGIQIHRADVADNFRPGGYFRLLCLTPLFLSVTSW